MESVEEEVAAPLANTPVDDMQDSNHSTVEKTQEQSDDANNSAGGQMQSVEEEVAAPVLGKPVEDMQDADHSSAAKKLKQSDDAKRGARGKAKKEIVSTIINCTCSSG